VRGLSLTLLIFLLPGLRADAGERAVERRVSARAGAFVEILVPDGSLEIYRWDRQEVSASGQVDDGVEDLSLETDGQRVWLEAVLAGPPGEAKGRAELKVWVPSRCHLRVRTVAASIRVRGLEGDLELESVSGVVRVEEGHAEAIEVSTVSGDVEILGSALRLAVRTVSGTIRIEQEVEELWARTTSGDLELVAPVGLEARLESLSGAVRALGGISPRGRLRVFTHEGSAELVVPPRFDGVIALETARGELLDELSGAIATEAAGRRRLDLRMGSGPSRIEARSISGSLRLRRGEG
jgi:hypothetical protein